MRRTVAVSVCVLIAVLNAPGWAEPVYLEADMNISVQILPGSENMRFAEQMSRQTLQRDPSDQQAALRATNYRMVIESGFQYSYPARLLVEMAGDGQIERYRVDLLVPYLNFADPSFTPQTPTVQYKERRTIIGSEGVKYLLRLDAETGEKIREELMVRDRLRALPLYYYELWFPCFKDCADAVAGKEPLTLKTEEFEQYEVHGRAIRVSNDKLTVRYESPPGELPELSWRFDLTPYGEHVFPVAFEHRTQDDKITIRFTVRRAVPHAEAQELLKVPEIVPQIL